MGCIFFTFFRKILHILVRRNMVQSMENRKPDDEQLWLEDCFGRFAL